MACRSDGTPELRRGIGFAAIPLDVGWRISSASCQWSPCGQPEVHHQKLERTTRMGSRTTWDISLYAGQFKTFFFVF
jgi:hypothetical protein